ncbi:NAD(P)/FAD-dependent oxidoreductase [Brevibacillus humidisoli]|uniref:NAD(P)/FAD-dependent oxidoreductase n=1 Tax=Brevibacillus humidisoli TaxID=2895522 RepID=UPI001E3E8988|nr:NAD(P)/FAD-dependent oxidoreductase [Brevibacillus humidisoli]UFJ42818.1 NAD(P)/FAD-dependent oxidoreductase [Brevibacillus humidisoli]
MFYDTIIIGGGIGGLQAAIQLGRSLRRVVVIDRQTGRSVAAKNYRNILGFPDGISGPGLRDLGIEQAQRVGVELAYGEVASLVREAEDRFLATLQDGRQYQAHTVLIATGMTDAVPDIPGLVDCLGESIYICPDCDGYEVKHQNTLVIGTGDELIHMSERLRYFTQRQTLVLWGEPAPDDALRDKLERSGFPWHAESIRQIEQVGGQLQAVVLASGKRIIAHKAFVAFSGSQVNNELIKPLQASMLPNGHVLVDARTKETSCRNVWAVGDVAAHSQMVAIAMGDGTQAAVWIHKRLLEQKREAVSLA